MITIDYFTDVLCIWAYGGQVKVDQLQKDFPESIELRYRFIPLFAAARNHVDKLWKHKGGMTGFSRHLQEIVCRWGHINLNPGVWSQTVPESSTGIHIMLKAIQLLVERGEIPVCPMDAYDGRTCFEEYLWRLRLKYFRDAENIAIREIRELVASEQGFPLDAIRKLINTGEAHAALRLDEEAQDRFKVPGSPTMVLNEGRQVLYGDVGYRVIEANIRELLHHPMEGEPSWC